MTQLTFKPILRNSRSAPFRLVPNGGFMITVSAVNRCWSAKSLTLHITKSTWKMLTVRRVNSQLSSKILIDGIWYHVSATHSFSTWQYDLATATKYIGLCNFAMGLLLTWKVIGDEWSITKDCHWPTSQAVRINTKKIQQRACKFEIVKTVRSPEDLQIRPDFSGKCLKQQHQCQLQWHGDYQEELRQLPTVPTNVERADISCAHHSMMT